MKTNNIFKLFIAIAVSELAGIIGSVFTVNSIPTWYATIARPNFAPPNWVFGPVWTTLFFLMGIALFLVWKQGTENTNVRRAMSVFGFQLVLNVLWSIIFFGFKSPGAAFVEIIVLWLSIFATIVVFYRVSKAAALLLVPYIAWVSFASFLNYMIWILNK